MCVCVCVCKVKGRAYRERVSEKRDEGRRAERELFTDEAARRREQQRDGRGEELVFEPARAHLGRYTILLLPILYVVVWHTQGWPGGRRILRNRRAIVLQ